jgi:hypothetical protein
MKVTPSFVIFGLALAFTALGACASAPDSMPRPGAQTSPDAQTGSITMKFSTPGGVEIDKVGYLVVGPSDASGVVDVSMARSSVEFVVGGLKAGSGYTIMLSATDTAGATCTSKPAPFDIVTGATTQVAVVLVCTLGDGALVFADAGTGSVEVDAAVVTVGTPDVVCPAISLFSVSPAEEQVGATSAIRATTDPVGAPVEYTVTPTSGTGGNGTVGAVTPSGATFTCTSAGQVTLSVGATVDLPDGSVANCPAMQAQINCEPALFVANLPGELPAPPTQAGCYMWTQSGWQTVACANSQDVDRQFSPPEVSDLGVVSVPYTSGGADQPAVKLVYGEVESTVETISPGTSGWSVQNNTNFYPCNTDPTHNCWVQFAVQTESGGTSAVCIWNWDVTDFQTAFAANPNVGCTTDAGCFHTCVGLPGENLTGNTFFGTDSRSGSLQAWDFANVAGSLFTDNSQNPPVNMIAMVAQYSWIGANTAAAQATEPFQLPGLYAIVTPDKFGLTGQWTETVGGILGVGGGAGANFGDAEVMTRVMVSSCPGDVLPTGPTCPGPTLSSTNVQSAQDGVTGESDNLTLIQPSTVTFPNEDLAVTEILSSTNTSSPSGPANCVSSEPDHVFIKDNDGDNGGLPSNSGGVPFWESPDIFVLPHGAPKPTKDAVAGDFILSPNGSYDVYLRVNNDFGCDSVSGLQVLIEGADPDMGFTPWSDVTAGAGTGAYVTDPSNTTVPPFDRAIVGPFGGASGWTPPGNGGHKCLLAAIAGGSDVNTKPAFPLEGAYLSNQIAQKNLQFSTGSECNYNVTNSTASPLNLVLGVSVSPATPTPGSNGGPTVTLTFQDPTGAFFAAWNGQSGISVPPPSGAQTVVTLLTSDVALNAVIVGAGQSPSVAIDITQPPGATSTPEVTISSMLTTSTCTGNACAVGIVNQNGGTCQFTAGPQPNPCAPGQSLCTSGCVDLQTDPANCGSCGDACSSGVCQQGVCASSCAKGLTSCPAVGGRVCVDLQDDQNNCGACGNACVATQCTNGACVVVLQ